MRSVVFLAVMMSLSYCKTRQTSALKDEAERTADERLSLINLTNFHPVGEIRSIMRTGEMIENPQAQNPANFNNGFQNPFNSDDPTPPLRYSLEDLIEVSIQDGTIPNPIQETERLDAVFVAFRVDQNKIDKLNQDQGKRYELERIQPVPQIIASIGPVKSMTQGASLCKELSLQLTEEQNKQPNLNNNFNNFRPNANTWVLADDISFHDILNLNLLDARKFPEESRLHESGFTFVGSWSFDGGSRGIDGEKVYTVSNLFPRSTWYSYSEIENIILDPNAMTSESERNDSRIYKAMKQNGFPAYCTILTDLKN